MPRLRRGIPRRLLAASSLAVQLRGRDGRAGGQRAPADRRRGRSRARCVGAAAGGDARGADRPPDGRLLPGDELDQLRRGHPRRPRPCHGRTARRRRRARRARPGAPRDRRSRRDCGLAAVPGADRKRRGGSHPPRARHRPRLPLGRDPRRGRAARLRPATGGRRGDRLHGPRCAGARGDVRGTGRRGSDARCLPARLRVRTARRPRAAPGRSRRHRRRADPQLRPARHPGRDRRRRGARLPPLSARSSGAPRHRRVRLAPPQPRPAPSQAEREVSQPALRAGLELEPA